VAQRIRADSRRPSGIGGSKELWLHLVCTATGSPVLCSAI
jgi:hypothetical protein